jgi:diaminopimelate decarboxylase
VKMYAPLIRHLIALCPVEKPKLDIGGGFPSQSRVDVDQLHDSRAFAMEIHRSMKNCGIDPQRVELWIEPGRALAEAFGVMVCTVVAIKARGPRSLLFVNVGGNALASRPILRVAEIVPRKKNGDRTGVRTHEIHGNLCIESDVICEVKGNRGAGAVGDLVLIGQAGAYDISTASEWMDQLPAVIGILQGKIVVLRPSRSPSVHQTQFKSAKRAV